MKKILFIVIVLLISTGVFSQQRQTGDEVDFLNTVEQKSTVTVRDAEILFKMVMKADFPASKKEVKKDDPVKKGYVALAVADNIGLNDSLLYKFFKSGRYAFRTCVAHKLLNPDASENDMMSGEELIEFLRLASEYKEGAAK
ncbi:MAG: hypothetical protein JW864_09925 [Spirochaetes bacterium]|nr:hypothetical protein [Spirochaetota bacterium]